MFEVSWDDPTKETVGQRKSRKENEQVTRPSELQSRASTSSDSTSKKPKNRPSILTLLNSNKKEVSRPTSRARVAIRERVPSRRRAHDSIAEQNPPLAREQASNLILDRYIVTDFPHSQEPVSHSPSDEQTTTFTSWASHSTSSSSSSPWSSTSDLAQTGITSLGEEWERSGRSSVFIQPLSPTSFVTRRTEVSIERRGKGDVEGGKGREGMGMGMGLGLGFSSTVVRIYADDGRKEEVREFYARLSPSRSLSPPPPPSQSSPPSPALSSTSDFTLHDPPPPPPTISISQSPPLPPHSQDLSSGNTTPRLARLILIDPETEFPPPHQRRHVRNRNRSPSSKPNSSSSSSSDRSASASRSRSRSDNGHGHGGRQGKYASSPNSNPMPSPVPVLRSAGLDVSGHVNGNGGGLGSPWRAPENWGYGGQGRGDFGGCADENDDTCGSGGEDVLPPVIPPKSRARLARRAAGVGMGVGDAGLGLGVGLGVGWENR